MSERVELNAPHSIGHRRTQDFTLEGGSRGGGRARRSGGRKSPSRVQGQSLGGYLGDEEKLKQNVKMFSWINLGFNEGKIPDKLHHPRSDAYSAEQVLLNK